MYALFGIRRQDFTGELESFVSRVHPDDQALVNAARESALESGNVLNLEYRILRDDDGLAWRHENAESRRGAEGTPVWLGRRVPAIT